MAVLSADRSHPIQPLGPHGPEPMGTVVYKHKVHPIELIRTELSEGNFDN